MQSSGQVFDIRRFSVHDGPGIRTTVFFAGCPLRCWWCHNPEAICLRPGHEALAEQLRVERGVARGFIGEISADTVMDEVRRDRVYYEVSDGGVTFSGGEPFAQAEFLSALLDRCRTEAFSTAVDTCGVVPPATLDALMGRIDLFLFDLKLADEEAHRHFTGAGNAVVRENLVRLHRAGRRVQLRFPFVPGVTATDGNMDAWMDFVTRETGFRSVSILPYHRSALEKYRRLKLDYRLPDTPPPAEAEVAAARARWEARGFAVSVGA